MAIDSANVGSNSRYINIVGDSVVASQLANVLSLTDALSLSGKYGLITGSVPLLENAGGTFDIARSAPGTTGIPSVSVEGTKTTFSFAVPNFTPVATATDILTLVGSGTKTIRLRRLVITGIATSGSSIYLQLISRSTANTSGTATQPALIPNDTNGSPAATAVVNLYSANPTLGTAVGPIRAETLNLGAAGAGGKVEWTFGNLTEQSAVLRGVTQLFCLNWAGQAVPAGTVLNIYGEFTEE